MESRFDVSKSNQTIKLVINPIPSSVKFCRIMKLFLLNSLIYKLFRT